MAVVGFIVFSWSNPTHSRTIPLYHVFVITLFWSSLFFFIKVLKLRNISFQYQLPNDRYEIYFRSVLMILLWNRKTSFKRTFFLILLIFYPAWFETLVLEVQKNSFKSVIRYNEFLIIITANSLYTWFFFSHDHH